MFSVSGSTSTSTGTAPAATITLAVAANVIAEVITSAPGPTPLADSARCSAAVQDVVAKAASAPTSPRINSSNRATFGPVVSQPDSRVRTTSATSSSPSVGRCHGSAFTWDMRSVILDQPDDQLVRHV